MCTLVYNPQAVVAVVSAAEYTTLRGQNGQNTINVPWKHSNDKDSEIAKNELDNE